MKNHVAIAVIFVAIFSMQSVFATGEQLFGSRSMPGASKVDACVSAKNTASSAAEAQIAFLRTTGQLRDRKYSIEVKGCDCDKAAGGFMCSADWAIHVESSK